MHPIKSFTVPSKTYNKVSVQHYYIAGPSSPLKLSPPPLVPSESIPISLLLQIPNRINMTNMTRHQTQFPLTTSPTKQTSRHSSLVPSPLPHNTNKSMLNCTFPKNLTYNQANLKELCNQGINVQVTIQDITKGEGFA